MSATVLKVGLLVGGILCLVLAAVLVVFAYMEYEDNAAKVRAMNHVIPATPFAGVVVRQTLQPGMPASSKFAILGAVLLGLIGGTGVGASLIWFLVSAVRRGEVPEVLPAPDDEYAPEGRRRKGDF